MSLGRGIFSLFSNPKPLTTKIYDTFIWAYEHSPINLSSITGIHHPDVSRLTGSIFSGRLQNASKDDNIGLTEEIEKLAQLAAKDKHGLAYCSYGHIPVLLVTKPSHIEQVSIHNDANTERYPLLEAFTYIFGHNNIFSIPTSQQWKNKRTALKDWIFNDDALDKLTEPMQKIIDEYIDKIKKKGEIPSLESFTIAFSMDLFSRSVFDINITDKQAEKISKTYNSSLISSSKPQNLFLLKLSAIAEYFHITTTQSLDKEKQNLQEVISDFFLKPNISRLKETENFLQHHFQSESKSQNIQLSEAYEDISSILLAGHETTSRLLQFTLILLADNPHILKKLREEIELNEPETGIWTREDLDKMSYLPRVLKEVLRLYPPVPIIPRMATEQFIIADIPRCKSKDVYKSALKSRDVTKDILISKGTILLISPWVTQRLESVYEKPLDFKPERFKSSSISPLLISKDEKSDDPCTWFPFGIGRHDCIGRKIAMQEAQLSLINMVNKLDFSVRSAHKEDRLLSTFMQGTLKHKGEVILTVKERESNEQMQHSLS